jgi:hypothetical protein
MGGQGFGFKESPEGRCVQAWGLEDIQIANGKVSVCTSGSLCDTLTKQTRSYQTGVFLGNKEKKTIVGHRYIAAVCDSLQSHVRNL